MNTRQQYILRALVEEYIRQGEPVSSGFLAEHYSDWDISPATIRNELLRLDEEGFLVQPHTSAGRVPTSRGYRFFVDNFLHEDTIDDEEFEILREMEDTLTLGDFLARQVHSLVFTSEAAHVHEAGWEYLIEEPEFHDREFLVAFLRRAEWLRKEWKSLSPYINSKPHLYIGEEAKDILGDIKYSFLTAPMEEERYIAFFGSTRMDYARGLAFAHYLSKSFIKE